MVFEKGRRHPTSRVPSSVTGFVRRSSIRRSVSKSHRLRGWLQEEARNVARAVAKAVVELRSGRLQAVQPVLSNPRPK